jgi:SAM-dependent methyltransferase
MNEIIIGSVLFLAICFGFVCFFGAPFVPTRKKWAEDALDLVKLKHSDTVVDLGSGNGSILNLIASRGAKAVGYEINPVLCLWSLLATLRFSKRTKIYWRNFWRQDLPSETTIVYVFAVMRDAEKLESYLRRQADKVSAKKLQVVTFGCWLPNSKPVKQTDGAALYDFN